MDAASDGSRPDSRPWTGGAVIVLLILGLDQASKWWIVSKIMVPAREIALTPFFNIVMVWNRGITFGLFGGAPEAGRWILVGLSLVIVAVLASWMVRTSRSWVAAALGAVIGGALGNVIDRLHYGAVADFLDFHYAGWHWPAFNLADSAIVIGVGVLMLDAFIAAKE
ncbi:MAG: signal peptidase II [Alphaproteobacteria bacterium]|nr:signal peptidase II [Alphaproteobacteria bacterium]